MKGIEREFLFGNLSQEVINGSVGPVGQVASTKGSRRWHCPGELTIIPDQASSGSQNGANP